MKNYADVFEGLGHMPGKLHLDIDETVKLVLMPTRRVPLALKSRLKDELDRLEALRVITKVTKPTNWVSNLVVAEKPNGKLRVCIDLQHLNQALKRSHYPPPIIEDILPDLDDVKVFGKVAKLTSRKATCKLNWMMSQQTSQHFTRNGEGGNSSESHWHQAS